MTVNEKTKCIYDAIQEENKDKWHCQVNYGEVLVAQMLWVKVCDDSYVINFLGQKWKRTLRYPLERDEELGFSSYRVYSLEECLREAKAFIRFANESTL